jgi:hypothetical protein
MVPSQFWIRGSVMKSQVMRSQRHRHRGYARRGPVKQPYDVVLIVCGGEKTEPNYLNALRKTYGLSSVNVRVVPPGRSDPFGIVRFAISQLQRDPDYDKAYCVFDRNGHANYDEALQLAQSSKAARQEKLFAIPSVPCFEIWLLLHYAYSNAPYVPAGAASPCDLVIRDLRAHNAGYSKGSLTVYAQLAERLAQANVHAERLERDNATTQSDNPSTGMHKLVAYLAGLKK